MRPIGERSEICLFRSYADSFLNLGTDLGCKVLIAADLTER